MRPYRFARRSFLLGIGGASGLELLLRNMEASAEGSRGPRRFLMMHWPVGTIRDQFVPSGIGSAYATSQTAQGPGYIIAPFDTPELRPHTIILHGFNMDGIRGEGGGHEDGTPFATTGAHSPGTRANGGEADDGCAGGPSWDQILLKHVPELSRRNDQGTIIGRVITIPSVTGASIRTRPRRVASRTATKPDSSTRRAPAARSGRTRRSCRK
jgi:hypothetical protein